MRATARWFLVLVAALLLSACGLLTGLIPDIDVADAFGLDGVPISLAADTGEVSALVEPPASTVVQGTISESFTLEGEDDIPAWVNAKSVTGGVGLGASLTMTHDGLDSLAESYTIVGASLSVTVSEGSSQKFVLSASVTNLNLVLTKETCGDTGTLLAGPESCTYTLSDVKLLDLALSGGAARAYSDMFRDGGDFTISGTFSLTLEPGVPSGTTVDVTLKSFPGVIAF